MAEELPVHPFTGLTALGVLASGRIVWPVLGASAEDDDAGDGNGDAGDDGQDDDAGDGDGLAEKGKKALDAERKARREAEKARKALQAELDELKAQRGKQDGDAGDGKPDADQIRRDAEKAATGKANARILAAEVKAAAAGKLADPSDAARYIDLSEFEVGDDGTVDSDAIAEAISDLIKKKPYLAAKATGFQGSGDGGARTGGPRARQLTGADLKTMTAPQIAEARRNGQLERYMSGG